MFTTVIQARILGWFFFLKNIFKALKFLLYIEMKIVLTFKIKLLAKSGWFFWRGDIYNTTTKPKTTRKAYHTLPVGNV